MAQTNPVLQAIEGMEQFLTVNNRAVILGGAALSFANPLYTPSDVDVFLYGPRSKKLAEDIIDAVITRFMEDVIIVRKGGSLVTMFRRGKLPVQLVLTTCKTLEQIIANFDISTAQIMLRFPGTGLTPVPVGFSGDLIRLDEEETMSAFGPGALAVPRLAIRSAERRTRLRLVSVSRRGAFIVRPEPTPEELETDVAFSATKLRWDADNSRPEFLQLVKNRKDDNTEVMWPAVCYCALHASDFDGRAATYVEKA